MKTKSGLALHLHHDQLFEYCYDYDERVWYILSVKPESEQELRLRLFKLIPLGKIPHRDSPEWEAYGKAGVAYFKAGEAYGKAGVAYFKAKEAYFCLAYEELMKLHDELCPDCPWSDETKTIFTRKNEKGEWY